MYEKIVIGIDQSYKRTGVSIVADGQLKAVSSCKFALSSNNTEKRSEFGLMLMDMLKRFRGRAKEVVVVVERIRLKNANHISEDYIKATAAMIARIIDVSSIYKIKVYSVATNAWKSKVVGSIARTENKYGIAPEKYNTIMFIKKHYPEYFKQLLIPVSERQSKGVIKIDGCRYTIDDDACDSICIALYAFKDGALMKEESF